MHHVLKSLIEVKEVKTLNLQSHWFRKYCVPILHGICTDIIGHPPQHLLGYDTEDQWTWGRPMVDCSHARHLTQPVWQCKYHHQLVHPDMLKKMHIHTNLIMCRLRFSLILQCQVLNLRRKPIDLRLRPLHICRYPESVNFISTLAQFSLHLCHATPQPLVVHISGSFSEKRSLHLQSLIKC